MFRSGTRSLLNVLSEKIGGLKASPRRLRRLRCNIEPGLPLDEIHWQERFLINLPFTADCSLH